MELKELCKKGKNLVIDGKVHESIKLLLDNKECLSNEIEEKLILQSMQIKKIQDAENNGLIDFEKLNSNNTRITMALLNIFKILNNESKIEVFDSNRIAYYQESKNLKEIYSVFDNPHHVTKPRPRFFGLIDGFIKFKNKIIRKLIFILLITIGIDRKKAKTLINLIKGKSLKSVKVDSAVRKYVENIYNAYYFDDVLPFGGNVSTIELTTLSEKQKALNFELQEVIDSLNPQSNNNLPNFE